MLLKAITFTSDVSLRIESYFFCCYLLESVI